MNLSTTHIQCPCEYGFQNQEWEMHQCLHALKIKIWDFVVAKKLAGCDIFCSLISRKEYNLRARKILWVLMSPHDRPRADKCDARLAFITGRLIESQACTQK